MKIEMLKLICNRCGHTWIPRTYEVRQCPKCKTAFWDTPKNKNEE
jgi:Zn finger protein HypA/HybF involved in hydrogenase expression